MNVLFGNIVVKIEEFDLDLLKRSSRSVPFDKITWIGWLRKRYEIGLKEAKDVVDSVVNGTLMPLKITKKFSADSSGSIFIFSTRIGGFEPNENVEVIVQRYPDTPTDVLNQTLHQLLRTKLGRNTNEF